MIDIVVGQRQKVHAELEDVTAHIQARLDRRGEKRMYCEGLTYDPRLHYRW